MNRPTLAAAALLATGLCAQPLYAQSQADLDARYNRALAAGYKAQFLCSAIANAEEADGSRTPKHVLSWELAGIQTPQRSVIGSLTGNIRRGTDGRIVDVEVNWADGMPPVMAMHHPHRGCSLQPLGTPVPVGAFKDTPIPLDVAPAKDTPVDAPAAIAGAFAEAYGKGTRTTAVLVSQGGRLLDEYYAPGFSARTPQRTWSVAKSIAATLVGAAVLRGNADVNASAGLGVAASDPRRAITIDQLLRMASGRYSNTPGNRTDPLYHGGATVPEEAASWPLVFEPGTHFRYANNDILMAIAAIKDTFIKHPPAQLFASLGMDHTIAETDWQGNYVLSSQVWATAPDLMRLGQLYLHHGIAPDGTRILPSGWVKYVSAPRGPQPAGDFGYGAGWWLFNKSAGVPPDTFAAMGNRGQYIVVVPARQVVIVRRGEDPANASRFDIAGFTRDVLASLKND